MTIEQMAIVASDAVWMRDIFLDAVEEECATEEIKSMLVESNAILQQCVTAHNSEKLEEVVSRCYPEATKLNAMMNVRY